MKNNLWINAVPAAMTLCDTQGKIVFMNERSVETFAAEGGMALIGSNVLDCHPEPARSKLKDILENRKTNVYTIQKNGVRKFVYQAPWFEDGKYCGLIEMVFIIPDEMPHFIRR